MKKKPTKLEMAIIKQSISDGVKEALDSLGEKWKELSFVNAEQDFTHKDDIATDKKAA